MMTTHTSTLFLVLAVGLLGSQLRGQDETGCLLCHGEKDLWEEEQAGFYVTSEMLARDIHWQKGLRCQDCHGGNANTDEYVEAHAEEAGFRALKTAAEIPPFCGKCHSDIEYMKRFNPSARTDQETEFWTSGHGKRLKREPDAPAANCVSCHGHHGILTVLDLESPVYPTRVAETCGKCHDDPEIVEGATYHGRPLGHAQRADWLGSVHGIAMMKKGDLSAPTCNDCHGNHGAVPPEVGSVANACGTCHGRIAELFANTRMQHQFEEVGLPGCATCHGNHAIVHPSDAMLGMSADAVCVKCHEGGLHGATVAGGEGAREMSRALGLLRTRIDGARGMVDDAERLGMEIRKARFDLQGAQSALTNARTLIHGFAVAPVAEATAKGLEVADSVKRQAEAAMQEHHDRRTWLIGALALITVVTTLLVLLVRRMPIPTATDEGSAV